MIACKSGTYGKIIIVFAFIYLQQGWATYSPGMDLAHKAQDLASPTPAELQAGVGTPAITGWLMLLQRR